MSISYSKAETILLSRHRDSIILCGMELSDGYLFSIRPKNWKDDQVVLDGFFKVSKSDGKISEYSPVMNPEEFKTAMKHVVYKAIK